MVSTDIKRPQRHLGESLFASDRLGNDAGPAEDVQIDMDPAGNAVAVWRQHDGTRNNIWANRYDVANGWGAAARIETDDAGNANSPRVVLDAAGNAIAVWHQSDGTRTNIWANRYAAGAWGTARMIEIDTGDAIQPDIGVDASGDAWVVWNQFDGTQFSVYANRYDYDAASATGAWGTAAPIESGPGDVGYTRIAMHAAGAGLAVWGQFDGNRYRLWANRYDAVTGWGSPVPIENGTDFIDTPQIEIDAHGNGIAIWTQYAGTQEETWVNRFTAGTWGVPMILSGTGGHAGAPQIAFDPLGNATAVWHQSDGTRDNIWARRFDIGAATWGAIQSLESEAGHADSAQIGLDASGDAVTVWVQRAGNRHSIMANTYR